jgi:hypothetical protein
MMSEVPLCSVEQLLLGIARELRPTFAEGDPPVPVRGCRHVTFASLHLVRPTESVGL